MATASATYTWDADCSVSATVTTDEGFPDALHEVTARCRQLLREACHDLAEDIAGIEGPD